MKIVNRIVVTGVNFLLLLPMLIIIMVVAILTSYMSARMNSNPDPGVESARNWVITTTVLLWLFFAGSILFMFTIGLVIIPYLVAIPYVFGAIIASFALMGMAIAGIIGYAIYKIYKSKDYKDESETAKASFNVGIVCIVMLIVSSALFVAYSIYTIVKYRKEGGLTGDIGLGLDVAAMAQPELAPEIEMGKQLIK